MAQQLLKDFESLEADGVITNEFTLVSENMSQNSPDWNNISPEAKQLPAAGDLTADESFVDCLAVDASRSDIVTKDLRPSTLQQSQELFTNTYLPAASNQQSAEPICTKMSSSTSSRRPKRFFRTFWCGITRRAVAMERKKKYVPL
jgi:hypothetical protein